MDGVALLKQYLSVKAVVDENEIIDIISRVCIAAINYHFFKYVSFLQVINDIWNYEKNN